jgi:hypothetical protein
MKEGRRTMRSLPLLLSHQFPLFERMWEMEAAFQPSIIEWMSTFTRDSFNFVNELFRNIFPSGKASFAISAANTVYESQGTAHVACISHVLTTPQIYRLDWKFR